MKIRASGTALLLSLALPALMTEVGLGAAPGAEPVALAQAADPVTEVARQRFGEGVKAFDAGRFEDARGAFLQAYSLKRNPMILLNLGQAEIKSNHPEDGGNHLQQFLHEASTASPDQKANAEKGIADAKKKSAFIVVIVDANQADVSIDGALIGKAPLLDPFFVKAGKHTLLASYSGKSATSVVDAKVGSATAANLTLGTTGAAGAAVVPVPVPTPTPGPGIAPGPTPTPTPAPTGGPVAYAPPSYPPPDQQPAPFMGPGPAPGAQGADTTTSDREPFFHWYKRKPIAWVGTGVTVVGLALGIGFTAAAGSASATATKHSSDIKTFSQTDASTDFGKNPPCGPQDGSGTDLPNYAQACAALRKDLSARSTDTAFAATGWVLFGVGAVGTVAYAMIDWYPKKAPVARTTPTLKAVPVVSSTQQGFAVVGSF